MLKYLGYAAFFVFAVLFFTYHTFPWDAGKDRVFAMIKKSSGVTIEAESVRPSWITGVDAKKVKVTPNRSKDPIELDRLQARARLLSFLKGKKGFTASAPVAMGNVDADVEMGDETMTVDADVEGVQLALVPALADAGYAVEGELGIDADLLLGLKDPKLSNGKVVLSIGQFMLPGGAKLGMISLPKDQAVTIGDVKLEIPVVEGTAQFKNTKIDGQDVEVTLDGTIDLMNPVNRSKLNLSIAAKPKAALLDFIGPLLNMYKRYKSKDGFYNFVVSGSIARPRAMPKRG